MAAIQPVLQFIKKNFWSLFCGVIAIAAVVFLFWPVANWYEDLRTTSNARTSVYSTLNGLLTKQRTLPVLDPFSTQSGTLNQFPTEPAIIRAQGAAKQMSDESAAILTVAMNAVKHQPLVLGALPNGGTLQGAQFRDLYQRLMSYPNLDPDLRKLTLPVTMLHAAAPPSGAEITAAQEALKIQLVAERTHYDSTGQVSNQEDVNQLVIDAQTALPDEMRGQVAANSRMYIAPNAIHINQALTGVTVPNTLLMFNAQTTLWLLQDVFTALDAANYDRDPTGAIKLDATGQPAYPAGGIPNMKVKHLLAMQYSDSPFIPASASFDPTTPAPPTADPLKPTSNPLVSPTGHVSNGMYDVVPFSMQLIVDASSVPDILATLSKDRFITVLQMDVISIDSGEALLAGYIYGSKPCVQLNISCEELFFRQDTAQYMPDIVKKVLGVAPTTPGVAAPAAGS